MLENQGINLSVALSNYGLSMVGMPGAVATPYTADVVSWRRRASSHHRAGGVLGPAAS